MERKYLKHLRGAEVWNPAQYTNPQAGAAMEPLRDRTGKSANISLEKEEMLRHKSFVQNTSDQANQLRLAGSAQCCVTEYAVK
jgi:hypothetical protein